MTGTSTVLARTLALLGNAGKRTQEENGDAPAVSGEPAGEAGFAQLMAEFMAASPESVSAGAAAEAAVTETTEIPKPDSLLASLDAVLQSINSAAMCAEPEEVPAAAPPLPSWQSPAPAAIPAEALEPILADAAAAAIEAASDAAEIAATSEICDASAPSDAAPVAEENPSLADAFPPDFDGPTLADEAAEASAPQEEISADSLLAPVVAEFAEPLPLLSSAAADMAKFFSAPLESAAAEKSASSASSATTPNGASPAAAGFEAWFLPASGVEGSASAAQAISPFGMLRPDEKNDTSTVGETSGDTSELPPELEEELGYGMPILPEPFKPIWKGAPDLPEGELETGSQYPGAMAMLTPLRAPAAHVPAPTEAANVSSEGSISQSPQAKADALAASAAGDDKSADTLRDLQTLMGDMKLTALRQETHFALPAQQSTAAQIADGIASEISNFPPSETALAARNTSPETDRDDGTVRVLHLRLDPPELGPLTVRMTLKHDALTVQLEAARPETASLIERDREAISGLLRASGYAIDGMTVQMASTANGGNLPGNGTQQQSAGQQMAGWQQPGGEMSGQTGQGQNQNPGGDKGQPVWVNANENAEAGPSRGVGGALYI